jgi:hypothetical protein
MEGVVTMKRAGRILVVLAASGASVGTVRADFVIELSTGGTIVAESYVEDGAKLRVHRFSGELQVDRAQVKAIRERRGQPEEAGELPPPPAAAETGVAPVSTAAAPAAADPGAPPVPPEVSPLPEDRAKLAALEGQLTRDLILANRDLLFARNRGEYERELERRRKEIQAIEKRRREVRARLGW